MTTAGRRAAGPPPWLRFARFLGPGLLVSVGYMDPGNWATDIEAGSRFGFSLLFVVALSSVTGILVQTLCARLGIASGRDLAQLCRERYAPIVAFWLWLLAELAIIACDVAEVLGAALALKLLFKLPIWIGILLTGLDTLLVLGLRRSGLRRLEAIVLALVLTIAACFTIEIGLLAPSPGAIALGMIPDLNLLRDQQGLYLAVGIIGATVMPHNLYLHSSIIQERVQASGLAKPEGIRFATVDIAITLLVAMLVNCAILCMAASAFHLAGVPTVTEIDQAYHLLAPIAGGAAALLFGVALLAAGQSSTFTATLAGQVIMDGFLGKRFPAWQLRLATRFLAIAPALVGIAWLGENAIGRLLVFTQVVLTIQLPFALYPLIRFTNDHSLMGAFASGPVVRCVAWSVFVVILAADVALFAITMT